jgi:hypothetical protein
MNSEELKRIAKKVLNKAGVPEQENFGSVIAILMIISIILTLVRVLQECNKNKLTGDYTAQDKYNLYGAEMKEYSFRRGWFTKMRIKKLLRRELPREQYEKYSLKLVNAILDTGENLQDDEVVTLVEAANV